MEVGVTMTRKNMEKYKLSETFKPHISTQRRGQCSPSLKKVSKFFFLCFKKEGGTRAERGGGGGRGRGGRGGRGSRGNDRGSNADMTCGGHQCTGNED